MMNCADGEMTADAKVILNLINALASPSFDPASVDHTELVKFFSRPTIDVPQAWLPMMEEITEHVAAALKRFPEFSEIDFTTISINKSA